MSSSGPWPRCWAPWPPSTISGRQGVQLLRLLEQLLASAALDRPSALLVQPSLDDVAALAREAGIAAQHSHPGHRITIEAGPLPVRADPLAISRILGTRPDLPAVRTH